jgi:drug/metabolite transporter (DMT)-like permease
VANVRWTRDSRLKTDAAIWVLVLIWAANFSVVKASLVDFHPLAFNTSRFLLASLLLALIIGLSGQSLRFPRSDWFTLIWLGVLGNTAYQVLFIFGIDWTLAGNAALMLATVPVFATLLSAALGHERVDYRVWVGAVLSFAGVGLVVWGGAANVRFGAETVRGDLTILAAAVAWSVYTVGSSPLLKRYGTLPVTAVTMWIGAVGLLVVSGPALAAQDWTAVRPGSWLGLAYSGVMAIAVAYLLWYYSVRRVGSSRTAVYSNTIPVVALIIAWLTLGETPGWFQIAGTVAILGGIGLARWTKLGTDAEISSVPPE